MCDRFYQALYYFYGNNWFVSFSHPNWCIHQIFVSKTCINKKMKLSFVRNLLWRKECAKTESFCLRCELKGWYDQKQNRMKLLREWSFIYLLQKVYETTQLIKCLVTQITFGFRLFYALRTFGDLCVHLFGKFGDVFVFWEEFVSCRTENQKKIFQN